MTDTKQTNDGADLLAKAMQRVYEEQVHPGHGKAAPEKAAASDRRTKERGAA